MCHNGWWFGNDFLIDHFRRSRVQAGRHDRGVRHVQVAVGVGVGRQILTPPLTSGYPAMGRLGAMTGVRHVQLESSSMREDPLSLLLFLPLPQPPILHTTGRYRKVRPDGLCIGLQCIHV